MHFHRAWARVRWDNALRPSLWEVKSAKSRSFHCTDFYSRQTETMQWTSLLDSRNIYCRSSFSEELSHKKTYWFSRAFCQWAFLPRALRLLRSSGKALGKKNHPRKYYHCTYFCFQVVMHCFVSSVDYRGLCINRSET